jgi:anti-sigma regulatory factor (Ser/Thr protein kinase)
MTDSQQKGTYYIKPAGRHIFTIGSELIKDQHAALVELVKNAYDADSRSVEIKFSAFELPNTGKGVTIEITDKGHGMSFETVTTTWMVPSTQNKLNNKLSKSGNRIVQGRKGIGRYAVSLLGEELILETVDEDTGILTTALINWNEFKSATYLSDVPIEIESVSSNKEKGTTLIIQGNNNDLEQWNDKEILFLIKELKKLIPPTQDLEDFSNIDKSPFEIKVKFDKNFPVLKHAGMVYDIEPYELLDLYHYRIWGSINEKGEAKLKYSNPRLNNSSIKDVIINIKLGNEKTGIKYMDERERSFCGNVKVDFRVYDRDPESIQNLINRGLKSPETGDSLGKREARSLLNEFNGIGVYRGGFRIRPLGDSGFDWLKLDSRRLQTPALRIGGDQVIGFVYIESEENSKLEEKSARDGLKENSQYFGLIEISQAILVQLEIRRFNYRKKIGLSRKKRNIEDKVNSLFLFDDLKDNIVNELDKYKIDKDTQSKIIELITEKEQDNNKIADEIKKSIAIYQGQATIGKIINFVLHEGNRSLNFFRNKIPTIKKLTDKLDNEFDENILKETVVNLDKIVIHSKLLHNLFKKINPLASRRTKKKEFFLIKTINESIDIFEQEINKQEITINVLCPNNLKIYGWKGDFNATFTNLIDNSIYWLNDSGIDSKEISIKVHTTPDLITIHFSDNGPGILEEFIESQVIFDTEFTTKTEGGGLGLAISGEAMARNDGQLKAEYPSSGEGAFFIIEIKTK